MKSGDNSKRKAILAYVPVLHEGYRRFFNKYHTGADLYILGSELTREFSYLRKDIRALDRVLAEKSIESWKLFRKVNIAEKKDIKNISRYTKIVVPNDEVMREIAQKYFPDKKIIFDDVFLMWDKHNSVEGMKVQPNRKISKEEFDKEIIRIAAKEAEKSSDWWRRIGSVIIKDGKVVITTHNHHLPTEYAPYFSGDPRNNFHKGDHVEISTSIHSEAGAVAEAARRGISLEGASIYVSAFPCPPCAKVIAFSGIKKLYYAGGYGVLDGEEVLKSKGVEIIYVDVLVKPKKSLGYISYKKRKK